MSDCPNCARLELEAQTYAEVAAGFQKEKARLEAEKEQAEQAYNEAEERGYRRYWGECDARIRQAEARESVMRSQLDAQYLAGVEWGVKHVSKREDWPQSWDAGFPGFKAQALIDQGPLSPDAGHALAAEVEKLREALKAVDRLRKRLPDPDFGEQQTTARAIGEVVRDALAKRGE